MENGDRRKKWLTWAGIGAFAFFLAKGLLWLGLGAVVWLNLK